MREHDRIDVLMTKAGLGQRIEQHMFVFDDTVAFFQFRFEERADTGLEQHGLAIEIVDQQGAAGQRDAVLLVGRDPIRPHGAWHVAKHGAAVETLGITENGPEFHHLGKSAQDAYLTSPLPETPRGSEPAYIFPLLRSQLTMFMKPQVRSP